MQLVYSKNELLWNGFNLSDLTSHYGSPLHVCNLQELHESIENFTVPFRNENVPFACHYSVKTNPLPEIIVELRKKNIGVEVINEYELWLTKRLGFKGDQIIVNGPGKSAKLFKHASAATVKMLSIESVAEFDQINIQLAKSAHKLNVGIRICPALSSSRFNFTLNSATKKAPFGFLANSRSYLDVLERIKKSKNLQFVGFHMHLGSGINSSKPYQKALSILEDIILASARHGLKTKYINIGGGFGSDHAPILSFYRLALSFLQEKSAPSFTRRKDNLISCIAKDISNFLARMQKNHCPIEEIITEPGRRLIGSAQITIITVLDVIQRGDGRRILICDGGAMSLSPMLLIERHQIVPLITRGKQKYQYTILGNLPSALDRVVPAILLPKVFIGDQLAILDTGAYFLPFQNNFAGPHPAVILIDGSKSRLIRRRETFDDLLRCDLLEIAKGKSTRQ